MTLPAFRNGLRVVPVYDFRGRAIRIDVRSGSSSDGIDVLMTDEGALPLALETLNSRIASFPQFPVTVDQVMEALG